MGTCSGSAAPVRAARWPALVAFAWMTACAGSGDRGAPGTPSEREDPANGASVVRGYLVLSDEVRSLKPCGEDRELAVGRHPALSEAYALLSPGEGAPVFVEVVGSRTTPEDQGGKETLAVRALRRAAPAEEGFGCGEDVSGFAFRASGVEPFWSVRVTPEGLTYTTPELAPTLFSGAEPRRDGEGWVYEASSSGPEALTLRLELQPGRCSDSMVGAVCSGSAAVGLGGAIHARCAPEGRLAPGG
mgnify:CR=1 FL=1